MLKGSLLDFGRVAGNQSDPMPLVPSQLMAGKWLGGGRVTRPQRKGMIRLLPLRLSWQVGASSQPKPCRTPHVRIADSCVICLESLGFNTAVSSFWKRKAA